MGLAVCPLAWDAVRERDDTHGRVSRETAGQRGHVSLGGLCGPRAAGPWGAVSVCGLLTFSAARSSSGGGQGPQRRGGACGFLSSTGQQRPPCLVAVVGGSGQSVGKQPDGI